MKIDIIDLIGAACLISIVIGGILLLIMVNNVTNERDNAIRNYTYKCNELGGFAVIQRRSFQCVKSDIIKVKEGE